MSDRRRHSSRDKTASTSQCAISTQDAALFREAMSTVTRQRPSDRRHPQHSLPSVRPRRHAKEDEPVMADWLVDAPSSPDMQSGDELSYRHPGVQHAVLRRLRRGHYRCQGEIDLHGMVVAVARQCLSSFLSQALQREHRCIRIIHGKGLSSGQRGPVLKNKVAGWLRQRDEVLAYVSARPMDGGTGALYVLLRKVPT